MVEPYPGSYEGGQEVPADRPGPPPSAHLKARGRNGGANSRPLSAATVGPTVPREPSDQASANLGPSGRVRRTLCGSHPQDPGSRAATGPTHGGRHSQNPKPLAQQPDRSTGGRHHRKSPESIGFPASSRIVLKTGNGRQGHSWVSKPPRRSQGQTRPSRAPSDVATSLPYLAMDGPDLASSARVG
jgi:hypothetical protein